VCSYRDAAPTAAPPIVKSGARALGVSIEAPIGEQPQPSKRGPTPKQRAVMAVLEAMLAQASR